MKIHPNRRAAQAAVEAYAETVFRLSQNLGVYEECEDSCANIFTYAKYYDENGFIQVYSE